MLRAGLTGSIAVGKSFVAATLSELGCHVLDADRVARELVAPGTPGLRGIVQAFGKEVLTSDGELDRTRLGERVFADEQQRTLLNSILHPLIISAQDEQLSKWELVDPSGIGVIDAALLIESGSYRRLDKIMVVHCRPEIQLERLIERNHLSLEDAKRRIAAQMPQPEKMSFADFLIDSSDGFEAVRKQTEDVYRSLKIMGKAKERNKGKQADF
jgi:dephospho-CoA kinase